MGQLNSLLIYSNQKKKTATTISDKPSKSVSPLPATRNFRKRLPSTNSNKKLIRLWQHLCYLFRRRPEVSVSARRTWCLSSFRVYNPRFGTISRCPTLPLYVSCSSARQPGMISNPAPSTPVYFRLLWTRWPHYKPQLSSRLQLVSPQLQPLRQPSSSRLYHRRCGSNQCRTPSHHDIGRPRINIISHHPVNGDPPIPPVFSSNETAPMVGVAGHAREDSSALHLASVAISVVSCPTSAVFVAPHPHNRTGSLSVKWMLFQVLAGRIVGPANRGQRWQVKMLLQLDIVNSAGQNGERKTKMLIFDTMSVMHQWVMTVLAALGKLWSMMRAASLRPLTPHAPPQPQSNQTQATMWVNVTLILHQCHMTQIMLIFQEWPC